MKHFMNIVPDIDVDSLSLEKVKQQGLSQRFAPAVETPHEF